MSAVEASAPTENDSPMRMTSASPLSATTPTNSTGAKPGAKAASHSRRPPRKSTLTQQQKNQKRQRATQEQLQLLEIEFSKNPTPTAAVRERIAEEIDMTERSVQIWFQNRRAKIKLLAKKSIETGEDCDLIPESYRQYLAAQALESGKPLARSLLAQNGGTLGTFGTSMLLAGEGQAQPKVAIQHFACRSLSVGSWRRVGQNAMDLLIFYSLGEKSTLTYYINNDNAGYKIEFPFSFIKNITLDNGQNETGRAPGLVVELNRPPNFYMDSNGGNAGGFYQCGDFTEDQQASQVLVHHLGGDPNVLSGQLAKLTLLESFQNRHVPIIDASAIAASAPVSPAMHRPASQPNHLVHPHNHHNPMMNITPLQQEARFGMTLQPGPRGHKRTRSRSVPAITDFSFLQHPMPSFHIQHPSTTINDPSIFAPVPHHQSHLNLNPGHSLRIDTNQGFGLDMRQHPMSAATTSPSEYASPSFFATSHVEATPPHQTFNNTFQAPFLSPMPEHPTPLGIPPSVSPLSAFSHNDPVIAHDSPPMGNLGIHRSASADFLPPGTRDDHFDGSMMLNDMYSKQSMDLPIRQGHLSHEANFDDLHMPEDPSNDDLDMQNILNFGTVDPSALNTEPATM